MQIDFQLKKDENRFITDWHKTEDGIVSRPIRNLAELLYWESAKIMNERSTDFILSNVPLVECVPIGTEKKLVVCHDMKGGYLDDKNPGGFDGFEIPKFAWNYISDFIYFSHHFITIPTASWIETCHRNKTRCLGTLITEWDGGRILCSALLQLSEIIAEKLKEIQEFYGFDGWLVNIENPVDENKDVPKLINFVELLKKHCGTVLWYDSVTINGELKWQDSLNNLNSKFFNASSGIFLNYTWNEEKLQSTKIAAGDNNLSVYAGVDVFGRGAFGGGEMNTDIAIKEATKNCLNSAIFAPGWLYEKNLMDKSIEFWTKVIEALTGEKLDEDDEEIRFANIEIQLTKNFYKKAGDNYIFSSVVEIEKLDEDFSKLYNLKIRSNNDELAYRSDLPKIPIQVISSENFQTVIFIATSGNTKIQKEIIFHAKL